MKFYLLPIFIFSFYFIVNFGLSSQQVVIISAVNNNSSVVSIRTPEEAISVEGVFLGRSISPGSLILTGEGDSIELQILPSRSIIVISENTEFEISTLQGVDGADSSDFRVPIGKFYAEIKKTSGNDVYRFDEHTIVTGEEETSIIGQNALSAQMHAVLDGNAVIIKDNIPVQVSAGDLAEVGTNSSVEKITADFQESLLATFELETANTNKQEISDESGSQQNFQRESIEKLDQPEENIEKEEDSLFVALSEEKNETSDSEDADDPFAFLDGGKNEASDSEDADDPFASLDSSPTVEINAQNTADPFASVDSLESEEVPFFDLNQFGYSLFENLSSITTLRYNWYLKPLIVDDDETLMPDKQDHHLDWKQDFTNYYLWSTGRFDMSGWFSIGNARGSEDKNGAKAPYLYASRFTDMHLWTWQDLFQDTQIQSNYLQFSEFYLTFYDFLNLMDIYIGKKVFSNTQSTLYSPIDIYKSADGTDPLNPFSIGRYIIQADLYFGDFSLTTAIFPVYQGSKSPTPYSRWGFYAYKKAQDDSEEDSSSKDERRYIEDISLENISYFARGKISLPSVDLMLHSFYGINSNIVLEKYTEDDEEKKRFDVVPVLQIGFSGSGTWEMFEFHGEVLYNFAPDMKDDMYLQLVAGTRVNLGKLIGDLPIDSANIVAEYAYEWLIAEQNNDNYERASNRAVKNDLLGGFRLQVDENWIFDTLIQYQLTDKGMFLTANVNWGWAEGYDMLISVQGFPLTPSTSQLYYWRDNHRFSLMLKREF